jgi:XTP/dITP diphosphohydrolase
MEKKLSALQRTLEIVDKLRVECPWDRKQTNHTLRPLTIEETYELADAIMKEDDKEIQIELGDLLLHILFYAKFAEEKNLYTIENVCNSLCDKLIYRHPHIFGSAEAKNSEAVEKNWAILKLREGKDKTVLGGVPNSLPSLIKAYRIQDKARGVGFDWQKKEDVWAKVKEEIAEVEVEIDKKNKEALEEEFGDLFFSLVNAARLYGIEPDTALERTNKKFTNRFNYIEQKAKEQGKILKELTLEDMDKLWEEAKKLATENK